MTFESAVDPETRSLGLPSPPVSRDHALAFFWPVPSCMWLRHIEAYRGPCIVVAPSNPLQALCVGPGSPMTDAAVAEKPVGSPESPMMGLLEEGSKMARYIEASGKWRAVAYDVMGTDVEGGTPTPAKRRALGAPPSISDIVSSFTSSSSYSRAAPLSRSFSSSSSPSSSSSSSKRTSLSSSSSSLLSAFYRSSAASSSYYTSSSYSFPSSAALPDWSNDIRGTLSNIVNAAGLPSYTQRGAPDVPPWAQWLDAVARSAAEGMHPAPSLRALGALVRLLRRRRKLRCDEGPEAGARVAAYAYNAVGGRLLEWISKGRDGSDSLPIAAESAKILAAIMGEAPGMLTLPHNQNLPGLAADAVQKGLSSNVGYTYVCCAVCKICAVLVKYCTVALMEEVMPAYKKMPLWDCKCQSAVCSVIAAKYSQLEGPGVGLDDMEQVMLTMKKKSPAQLVMKALRTVKCILPAMNTVQASFVTMPMTACLKHYLYSEWDPTVTFTICEVLDEILAKKPQPDTILTQLLCAGILELTVLVLNYNSNECRMQVICCRLIALLVSKKMGHFSSINPAVQAVLAAINRNSDLELQSIAFSALEALVNHPQFRSYKVVLQSVLRATNNLTIIPPRTWNMIAKTSEKDLEVGDASQILDKLVEELQESSNTSAQFPDYVLQAASHVATLTTAIPGSIDNLSLILAAFFSVDSHACSASTVCAFIENLAPFCGSTIIEVGGLDQLCELFPKTVTDACKAVMALAQDQSTKDQVASKAKPILIGCLTSGVSNPVEVGHLWRALECLEPPLVDCTADIQIRPVLACMLSEDGKSILEPAYARLQYLACSELCSLVSVLPYVTQLFPLDRVNATAACVLEQVALSLTKPKLSWSPPIALFNVLLSYLMLAARTQIRDDDIAIHKTWAALLLLTTMEDGMTIALKSGILSVIVTVTHQLTSTTSPQALEKLIHTFNGLVNHTTDLEAIFSEYIVLVLRSFPLLKTGYFSPHQFWKGIVLYVTGQAGTEVLWENVFSAIKTRNSVPLCVLGLKTLHMIHRAEPPMMVHPCAPIITQLLSTGDSGPSSIRLHKWAFRCVIQVDQSWALRNTLELARQDFISHCFAALSHTTAKVSYAALKSLCYISSTPFGAESIKAKYDIPHIVAQRKWSTAKPLKLILRLFHNLVSDTTTATEVKLQLGLLPIRDVLPHFSSGQRVYFDVYSKLLQYDVESPMLFPDPSVGATKGGTLCNHRPNRLCDNCYYIQEYRFCITCDGPSSKTNYCPMCISASHNLHELSPPVFLMKPCHCAAMSGFSATLTLLTYNSDADPWLSSILEQQLVQSCGITEGACQVHIGHPVVGCVDAQPYSLLTMQLRNHTDDVRVVHALNYPATFLMLYCGLRFPRVGAGSPFHTLTPAALVHISSYLITGQLFKLVLFHGISVIRGPTWDTPGSDTPVDIISALSFSGSRRALSMKQSYTPSMYRDFEPTLPVCKHCWLEFALCRCPVVDNYWCRATGKIISQCTCGCKQQLEKVHSGLAL
ncbi:hypothetical protein Pelo_15561 [Pelomyxa schiedti]|nr:hypothetical protein Pelo_15561 [Pelomyxa schiedti]